MNTEGLKLPSFGVITAQFIDGMRECASYDVRKDEYVARWDTVINGEQRVIWAEPLSSYSPDRSIEEWLSHGRTMAKAYFEAEEAMAR